MAITPTGARLGPAGTEPDLLYIACLVALVLGGSGPFAIDNLFAVMREKQNSPARAS
jgi:putative oxidoreductase